MSDTRSPVPFTIEALPSPYVSPLLERLPAEHGPDPLRACTTCPASMWRTTSPASSACAAPPTRSAGTVDRNQRYTATDGRSPLRD